MKRSLIVMCLALGIVVGTLGPAAVAGQGAPIVQERYRGYFSEEWDGPIATFTFDDTCVGLSGRAAILPGCVGGWKWISLGRTPSRQRRSGAATG